MRYSLQKIRLFAALCGLILLILYRDYAIIGAQDGITQCIQVIIPSLFPFFFITAYLNPLLLGISPAFIRRICKHFGIPIGCEGILLLGLVGGYPVGAQSISEAYHRGTICKNQAKILLGYCSNAGPAFIFGVIGQLFDSPIVPWLLWLIQILSALITGLLLPKDRSGKQKTEAKSAISFPQALQKSLQITASVCGWIILFKVIMAIFIIKMPTWVVAKQSYYSGFLELSGGCLLLKGIGDISVRFILCAVFLSFGGICVFMQTISAAVPFGLGLYLPGKLIQTCISILLCLPILLIEGRNPYLCCFILLSCVLCIYLLRRLSRKKCGNYPCYVV